ncbi:membrane protein [Methylopila jiangsuensis]|uniref:Membrane protein n=1 Tax=Methylopila jiangsuensis TaxID=586230 RepID=A0A9W6N5D7_9HYPH|nr:MAPEG family protein [Methylopila jiangsuensis]MDR6284494.1 putative membrane protein YecN with MAPEG domain [Methylopila jiangsuensis]GLK78117.1 membrane protein [Methylopila jiangsuensis]
MEQYSLVALVTLAAALMVFGMALFVARTHASTGILAPTMTGDPVLERAIRAHANTVEWTPIFFPSLWVFAVYCSTAWASALGTVWIAGRIVYFMGYVSAPGRRFPGFFVQSAAVFAMLFGAAGKIVYASLAG